MQKITLICVGKMTDIYAKAVHEYEKRLQKLCMFTVVELPEVVLHEKSLSQKVIEQTLSKEGERILAAVPKQARLLALCIEGKQMDSTSFSKTLTDPSLPGQVALVIGSSHGLSKQVKDKADLHLSLSSMTFPHQLARLLLTEQIYRAFMIQTNHAYHK